MFARISKAFLAAAATGAVLIVMSAAPASAFTLSSPSPAAAVAGADIQHVWWDRWHHWHGGGYWGHPHWAHRHCWMTPWGMRCRVW